MFDAEAIFVTLNVPDVNLTALSVIVSPDFRLNTVLAPPLSSTVPPLVLLAIL